MRDELYDLVCEFEALRRYRLGEKPGYSTGICGSLTMGYGDCDDYGYWQFPLYLTELPDEK